MASMFRYLEAAMNSACYEQIEDRDWFASIPALQGLWASGHTVEGGRIPDINGVRLYHPLKKVAGSPS